MKYFYWPRVEWRELLPNNANALLTIFSSLRSPNFRLYFLGQCVSLCGSWIQNIALSWLVYRMTGSVLLLATVTFVNQIPNLVLTPFAGVLSDRFNKHKILITTQALFMLQALLLTILVLGGWIQVWQIISLSLFAGLISAVEAPTRQSFYTQLVPKTDLSNAIALNSVTINGSRFIGPTIGGLLIAGVGEGYCFLLNTVSYIAVLTALLMMRLAPYVRRVTHTNLMQELTEGFYYVRHSLPLRSVLLLVASISFFGLPFMTLIPALVKENFGGDAQMLGYMMSSVGIGSLTAAIYLAARKSVMGLGKVVTIAAGLFGVGLILISFVHHPAVAYLICFPIGFGFISLVASCNTLLQTMVAESKRGRVMSFFTMAFVGMNPLGGMVAGALAGRYGINPIILVSGVVCLISGATYEHYRPLVRLAAQPKEENNGVIREIAVGIEDSNGNPF